MLLALAFYHITEECDGAVQVLAIAKLEISIFAQTYAVCIVILALTLYISSK